jgi:hypothetical protein
MTRLVSIRLLLAASLIFVTNGSAIAAEPFADQPLAARASAGKCRLVVRGSGAVYAVMLTGLTPGETFLIKDISEHEVIEHEETATAKGEHFWISLPAVRGKTMGTATIAAKASRCQLSVSYGWNM